MKVNMSKNKPNNNSINLRHGGGIVNRQDEDINIILNISDNTNQDTSVNPEALSGGNTTTAANANNRFTITDSQDDTIDESDRSDNYWNQFLDLLTNLYDSTEGNLLQQLNCPGNQTRGWRFFHEDKFIELAPCGCYREALWPNLLAIPAAWRTGAKIAAKKLVKKARNKFNRTLLRSVREVLLSLDEKYYKALKILPYTSFLRRKLPPVPDGFIRLWRGQGNRRLQKRTRNQSLNLGVNSPEAPIFNSPDGYWWIKEEGHAIHYTWDGNTTGLDTSDIEREIFYIDIPIAEAEKASLSRNNTVLGLLEGQTYCLENSVWDPNLEEYVFRPEVTMPLRRMDAAGNIIIVTDHPTKADMKLNPAIFTTNDNAASIEYYLDSPANGTNFLEQVKASTNLAYEHKLIALQKIKEKTEKTQKSIENLRLAMRGDEETIATSLLELESSFNQWKTEILKHFEVYDYPQPHSYFQELEELFTSSIGYYKNFFTYFIGIIGFINTALEFVTIVETKYCGPKDSFYKTFSNIPGSTFSLPKELKNLKNEDWDDIRNQLIEEDAKTIWAEFDEDCECKSCPETWNLCTSFTPAGLLYDCFNTCIKCTESTSDDTETILYGSGLYAEPIPYEVFEPVYAEHSKVPIILSHKSTQLLFGANSTCNCWCPISHLSRLDKNGQNTIPGNRILRDDVSQTCLTYTHGQNKTSVFIPGSQREHDNFEPLIIEPQFGLKIPGIPFETIKLDQVCDLAEAPDGLPEYSIFPWVTTSAYKWSPTLGRWTCKQTKECESPQIFTEGVGDNNEYCDCVTVISSSSSSSSVSTSSSSSSVSTSSSSSSVSTSSSSSATPQPTPEPTHCENAYYCTSIDHTTNNTTVNDCTPVVYGEQTVNIPAGLIPPVYVTLVGGADDQLVIDGQIVVASGQFIQYGWEHCPTGVLVAAENYSFILNNTSFTIAAADTVGGNAGYAYNICFYPLDTENCPTPVPTATPQPTPDPCVIDPCSMDCWQDVQGRTTAPCPDCRSCDPGFTCVNGDCVDENDPTATPYTCLGPDDLKPGFKHLLDVRSCRRFGDLESNVKNNLLDDYIPYATLQECEQNCIASSSSSSSSSSSTPTPTPTTIPSSSSSSSGDNFTQGFPITVTLSGYTGYSENCDCYDGVYIIGEPDVEYSTNVCPINSYVLEASVSYQYVSYANQVRISIHTVTPDGSFEHFTWWSVDFNTGNYAVQFASPGSPWCNGSTTIEFST